MKLTLFTISAFLSLALFSQEDFCHPDEVEHLSKEIILNLSTSEYQLVLDSPITRAVRQELFFAYDNAETNLSTVYNYLSQQGCNYYIVDNVEEVLYEYTYYKIHEKDTCMSNLLQPMIDKYFEEKARRAKNIISDSIDGIYIPKDLDDCFVQIDSLWNDSIKSLVKSWSEDEFVGNAHHSFGMWLRNNWGLWGGSRLSIYFNKKGIYHPDDMSGIILKSYHRYLTDEPIKFRKQINFYKNYWASQKADAPEFRAYGINKEKYYSVDSALVYKSNIVEVDLSGYKTLPRKIKKFTNLKELSIEDSPELNLSKTFNILQQFDSLKKLTFFENEFTEYPETLGKLTQLTELWIDSDSISELPNSISNLKNLEDLMVSFCRNMNFELLIDQISPLEKLAELDLEGNELAKLPSNIIHLSKLKKIDLSENKFREFPTQLKKMDALEYVSLFQNQIESLDFKNDDLPNLSAINLSYNSFEIFPIELSKLPKLKRVLIWHCNIYEVPNNMERLNYIEHLSISGNPLSEEDVIKIKSALPDTITRF